MRFQPVFADAVLNIERHAEVERVAHGLRDECPDDHDLDSRPADDTGQVWQMRGTESTPALTDMIPGCLI